MLSTSSYTMSVAVVNRYFKGAFAFKIFIVKNFYFNMIFKYQLDIIVIVRMRFSMCHIHSEQQHVPKYLYHTFSCPMPALSTLP